MYAVNWKAPPITPRKTRDAQPTELNVGITKNVSTVWAIGIRIRKWIAYHGFALNITNNLLDYNKIIPCGIKDKGIINLKSIKDQSYKDLNNKIIHNFIKNLKI